jgi:hypothetical protein
MLDKSRSMHDMCIPIKPWNPQREQNILSFYVVFMAFYGS